MFKLGNEIQVGDHVANSIDAGAIGSVRALKPYTGSLVDLLGKGTQIATFHGGMEMTLPAVSTFRVAA